MKSMAQTHRVRRDELMRLCPSRLAPDSRAASKDVECNRTMPPSPASPSLPSEILYKLRKIHLELVSVGKYSNVDHDPLQSVLEKCLILL